jgi:imidazolonepropionase
MVDAKNCVVMPGFVDPHTHVVWAGDRAKEFTMKMSGMSYLDILAAGGGILSTVKQTRAASANTLVTQTHLRLMRMFAYGTTTVEVKTGYGLQTTTELKVLKALITLQNLTPVELSITFLGAHAIAPEFKGSSQGYTNYICKKMLFKVKEWWQKNAKGLPLPFFDVFCETGAFSLKQTRQLFTKAKELGFPLKVHADEFDNLGAASLAAKFHAVSADHLVKISKQDIVTLAKTDTVAVSLPCTPFGLAESDYTPAREIIHAGGILALATDCNPGTAWNESMQLTIALACRYMKLTPAEAIVASTINAAHAIRRADTIGSLEKGKNADLLILDIPNYRHLGYRFGTNLVKQVIKHGRVYKVANFNTSLK